MQTVDTCCICKKTKICASTAFPVVPKGLCCDVCSNNVVSPVRSYQLGWLYEVNECAEQGIRELLQEYEISFDSMVAYWEKGTAVERPATCHRRCPMRLRCAKAKEEKA